MKNGLIVAAVVSVAAVLIVWQQFQISDLKRSLAMKPEVETVVQRVEVPVAAPVAPTVKPKGSAGVSDEAEAAFQESIASASTVAPTTAAPEAKKGLDLGAMMKSMSAMLTNDAMKGMMRAQAEMQLDMQYGRLFKYLNLPPEKAAALKKLMADRQGSMMADGLSFMSDGFNKEGMEKRGKEMKSKKEAFDKEIAELLGPDDYDAFKQYEDTSPERQQVELLKHQLASSGEPLSDQQEADLVNRFHSARTNSPALRELMREDQMPDPALFSSSGMTNIMSLMDRQQEQNNTIAQGVLSPAQFQQYTRHAEQQRTMQQLGIQMAAQMFGGLSNAIPAGVGVQVQTGTAP